MAKSADRLEARRLVETYAGRAEPKGAPAEIDYLGLWQRMGRRLSYLEDRALRDAHRFGVGSEAEEALVDGGGIGAVEKLIEKRRASRVRILEAKHGKGVGSEVARLLELAGR